MTSSTDRLHWWRESRFGLFIHWGLYSLLGRGEWVMYDDKIPVQEYEKLAHEFNPAEFDAESWVKLAKSAGMKYIVITAKHHDGFSMFRTKVSRFNMVDATPYGRDVMSELAQACQREGLTLGFYYSHVREWRHPHAQSLEVKGPTLLGNYGNSWDYREEWHKNLQTYLDEFDKPQLKELLTQYGPIGIIWFDTPSLIRPDQAQELVDLVRELQPNCLVNSRVADDPSVTYDYLSLGDCEIPGVDAGVDWETPMTICEAWGYNAQPDNQYRSPEELIHQLVDIVSMGGNYLLNVGPTPNGVIPQEAQDRLATMGQWIRVNGEAIYGTEGSPFKQRPDWGRVTYKDHRLYLHVYRWKSVVALLGLASKARRCYFLADPSTGVAYKQSHDDSLGIHRLELELPARPLDPFCTVIVVELDGPPQVNNTIAQDDAGIRLSAIQAAIHREAEGSTLQVSRAGSTNDWFDSADWLSWDYVVTEPGEYDVDLVVESSRFGRMWDYGHEVEVIVGSQKLTGHVAKNDAPASDGPLTLRMGRLRFDTPSQYRAVLKATEITRRNLVGLRFMSLELVRSE